VAHFAENQQQHPLAPEEIQQDSRNKELGHSSKGLSVKDFNLVRTLGTGTCVVKSVSLAVIPGHRRAPWKRAC
jgi:hypothetical protein